MAEGADPDREIADLLRLVERGEASSMDQAIGLVGDWQGREAGRERDRLLLFVWRAFYADESCHRVSATIESALGRYRNSAWRNGDRKLKQNPYADNEVKHFWFAILRSRDVGLSSRNIREILATQGGMASVNEIAESGSNKGVSA